MEQRRASRAAPAVDLARWPLVGRDDELELASAALTAHGSVVLTGAAGVGKTRLAHEVLALVAAEGDKVEWVAATQAAATIPLGSVAHLVPGPAVGGDRETTLRGIVGTLNEDRGGGHLLLGVDDAHLLDDASAALVQLLVSGGSARAVVTLRSGYRVPDPIVSLWKDGPAPLVALQALSQHEVETIVTSVLEGQVDGTTLHFLWTESAGNALFLRELVRHGVESGALHPDHGVWRWPGRVEIGERLHDLVAMRMGSLSSAERVLLEMVAIGEPLGVAAIRHLDASEVAERLERRGLLAPSASRPNALELAHPLFGEVLRSHLPAARLDAMLLGLADAVDGPDLDDGERLRVALWRADAGDRSRPDQLLAGARRAWALWDAPAAERLARAALEAGPDLEAGYLLGESLSRQGRSTEALASWSEARDLPGPDRVRIAMAMSTAGVLRFHLDRPDDARTVLLDALRRIDSPTGRGRLEGALALLGGQDPISGSLDPDDLVTQPHAALAAVIEWTVTGRLDLARQTARDALAAVDEWQNEAPLPALMLRSTATWAALLRGDVLHAEAEADACYDATTQQHADYPRVNWCLLRGIAALARGRPRVAGAALREGLAVMGTDDRGFHRPMAAYLAIADALLGDVAATARDEHVAAEAKGVMDHLFAPEVERSRAWVLAATGELRGAAEQAVAAAEVAAARGHRSFEVLALHDVARFDGASAVVDRLTELAAEVDGPLVDVMAAHAEALALADGAGLVDVSQRFEALGLDLLAAEASVVAARVHREEGRRGSAFAAADRARVLRARCEGATTPALAAGEVPDDLTAREREVAHLAASDLTSRAIGERLGITTRTVDNLLGRVYTKLDIGGRQELIGLFGGDDATRRT